MAKKFLVEVPYLKTFPSGQVDQKISDYQRSKVYAAERLAFSDGKRMETVREIQAYCDRITESVWWKRRVKGSYRGTQIFVHDGCGRSSACAYTSRIDVPRHMRKEWIILHELAHCMTGQGPSRKARTSGHGREFAANYLALVQHKMGKIEMGHLREEFRHGRVKYTGSDEAHFTKVALRKARNAALASGEVEPEPVPWAKPISKASESIANEDILSALKRWGYV